MKTKLSPLSLAITMVISSSTAYADELAPITISADLRESTEQEIPASVDVKTQSELQDQGATHFDDVLLKTPNVNFSGQSSRARHIQIRGLGERDEYTGAPNSSVGFAIDDIDFSGIGMTGNLFDTKQVEVLRGPQNTRYGQSAIGGLINIQTNNPTATLESMIEASAGDDSLRELGLMTSGPISSKKDAAQYRFTLFKHQSDGFRENKTLGRSDTNGRDELTIRGKLRLFPSAQTTVDISLIHADLNNKYDAWSRNNNLETYTNQPGVDKQLSNAASVKAISKQNPNFVLTSKTSLANTNAKYNYDADWIANPAKTVGTYANKQHRQNMAQEFKWTSTENSKIFNNTTDWTAGLYFSHLNESNNRTERYNYTVYSDIYNTDASRTFSHNKFAAFSQLDQAINNKTTVSYSLRVEQNQQDFDLTTRQFGFDTSYGSGAFDYTLVDNFTPSETLWGGSIHYKHQYNPVHTAFVGVTRGYKAGGFNPALTTSNVKYDSETLYNYEIGLNSNYSQYKLKTSTTFFYMDRQNPQFDGYSYEPGGYEWVFFTENLDSAKNYGLESSIDWEANNNINIFGSIGILQTEVFGTPINSAFKMSGRDQAHAPNYQANLGVKYRNSQGFYAQTDITAVDGFYFDNVHNFKSQAYKIINARVGYEADNYEVYAWAKNLTDEFYATRGFEFDHFDGDGSQQYTRLGDPRQLGVTARVYF